VVSNSRLSAKQAMQDLARAAIYGNGIHHQLALLKD